MIKLNCQRAKQIKFGVSVAGVDIRDLKGAVRLTHEGIEYGFQIQILDEDIFVEIPPLENIILKKLNDNDTIEAKLEIIADDVYSVPWADTIRIERPIKVEATIQETEEVQEKVRPDIRAKVIAELESKPEKKKVLSEKKKPVKKDEPKKIKITPKWLQ